jgi:hypothetical protein
LLGWACAGLAILVAQLSLYLLPQLARLDSGEVCLPAILLQVLSLSFGARRSDA